MLLCPEPPHPPETRWDEFYVSMSMRYFNRTSRWPVSFLISSRTPASEKLYPIVHLWPQLSDEHISLWRICFLAAAVCSFQAPFSILTCGSCNAGRKHKEALKKHRKWTKKRKTMENPQYCKNRKNKIVDLQIQKQREKNNKHTHTHQPNYRKKLRALKQTRTQTYRGTRTQRLQRQYGCFRK